MQKTSLALYVSLCLALSNSGSTPVGAAALGATSTETAPAQQSEDPATPSALAEAIAELQEDNLDGAIAILERPEASGDADPRLAALLGALYQEAGRSAEALEVLAPLAEAENADVAVLYNAGRAAASMEDFDRAQRYLEASVAAFPASPAARELGFLHLRRGRLMPAYLSLRPWSQSHPNDSVAITAAARCAVRLGRGAEAEQLLQLLSNDEPTVKLLWANALLLKGDAWSALAVAKELSENPPEALEPQVLTLLADVYLELEQPDLVVEALSGKTDRRPLVAVRLATALRTLGEHERALELLVPFSRGLIEDDPEVGRWLPGLGGEVALEYGRLLAEANRHAEAIAFLRASTEMAPQEAEAWKALAAALDLSGDGALAQEARARVARIEALAGEEPSAGTTNDNLGSDPTARQLRRAQALLGLGAEEEGLRVARQEKTLVPEDPRPPLVEAQMLIRLGHRDEALAVMDTASERFPASADVHYYRGVVQMSLNRLEAAEPSLRQAIELAPQHTPALTDLAVLLLQLNRRAEARTLVERVLAIAPGDPTATRLLEQIESS